MFEVSCGRALGGPHGISPVLVIFGTLIDAQASFASPPLSSFYPNVTPQFGTGIKYLANVLKSSVKQIGLALEM